ncbi:hypothetical protein AAW14_21915 [Streptomyces hygroscopicus]|nr:hypothetical protein [Streptomyces hygroscopicus]
MWRYPVKSMAGERLDGCDITVDGLLGDRWWAVRDEERGCIADARRLPALLDVRALYVRPPETGRPAPAVELRLSGGRSVSSDDADVHGALTEHLGRKTSLWPRLPAERQEHYARVWPEDAERYLVELFGVKDVTEVPDLSGLPPDIVQYQTIPGTYFDAYPLHLITSGALEALERAVPAQADVRRFRPNLVLDGPADPGWVGRSVRVGSAVLRVETTCPRCVMISLPQQGLPTARELLRTVHREFGHDVGFYASVERPGRVSAGDRLDVV